MRRHVYYYTIVPHSYDEVAARLTGDPGLWLPSPGVRRDDGWLVSLHADGALPGGLSEHEAIATVLPTQVAVGDDRAMMRPLRWRSASTDRFVPVLDADLELAELNGSGCHLSIMGSYRPPLSVVGGAGDRLLGHRVAEACVRRFVLDIADRMGKAATLPA